MKIAIAIAAPDFPTPTKAAPGTPDVASNAGFAMFAKLFYLATRLMLPPLVLAHLSLAEYGLWSACFVLIMYIGLTDVGFSSVYVRFIARFHAENDASSINRLVSTGVLTLSLIALLVWTGLWLALPSVLDFLKVAPGQRHMAQILVMGSAAMFLLDLSLGAYCYVLHGLQRIREEQKVAIVGYVLELALILGLLRSGLGVYSLLVAFVLRYAWSLTCFVRLAHRFLPELAVRPRNFDPAMLRHFFGYGFRVQISALLGTALFSVDRLIAGFLLGPKGIALFELGAKLPVAAISIPSAISNVAMPAAARHTANGDRPAVVALYRNSSRATCLLAGLPLGFMAIFSTPLSFAWLGARDELESLPLILALTALSSHLHITTGPGSAVFRAMGHVGNEFVYHGLRIAALAVGIGAAVLLMGPTAHALIIGLAGGGSLAAVVYLIHNQHRFGLPHIALLREILLPGFLAYPVAALVLLIGELVMPDQGSRLQAVGAVALSGLTYTALWAAVVWMQLRDDERVLVSQMLARFSGLLRKWRST